MPLKRRNVPSPCGHVQLAPRELCVKVPSHGKRSDAVALAMPDRNWDRTRRPDRESPAATQELHIGNDSPRATQRRVGQASFENGPHSGRTFNKRAVRRVPVLDKTLDHSLWSAAQPAGGHSDSKVSQARSATEELDHGVLFSLCDARCVGRRMPRDDREPCNPLRESPGTSKRVGRPSREGDDSQRLVLAPSGGQKIQDVGGPVDDLPIALVGRLADPRSIDRDHMKPRQANLIDGSKGLQMAPRGTVEIQNQRPGNVTVLRVFKHPAVWQAQQIGTGKSGDAILRQEETEQTPGARQADETPPTHALRSDFSCGVNHGLPSGASSPSAPGFSAFVLSAP